MERVALAMAEVRLEAVLIGNAAAALQDVPVTTQDLDFFVRDTPLVRKKLRDLAGKLGGLTLTEPFAPASNVIRALGAQVPIDFVFQITKGWSFERLRSRSRWVKVGSTRLRVADLADIIETKRAAGRPRDKAVLPLLEAALRVLKAKQPGDDTK